MVNFAKMLGMESKSTPNYNAEREAERQRIQSQYDSMAQNWNNQANWFNAHMSAVSGVRDDVRGRAQSANIGSQDSLRSLDEGVNWFSSALNHSYFGDPSSWSRPTFTPTQSLFGQNVTFNIPTLVEPNTNLFGQLRGDLDSIRGTLGTLQTNRQNEERRLNDFRTGAASTATNLGSMLEGLNIADTGGINSARSGLAGLRSSLDTFSSPLGPVPGVDLAPLEQRLNSITAQRTAEESRIRDFENAIFGLADNLRSGLQGLSIRDIDRISALDNQLEEKRRTARRFSSALPFDLSQELYELDEVDRFIEDLKTRRASEEARINAAQNQFLSFADDLTDRASGLDIFSRPQLDAVASALSRTRRDMDRFTSDLDFDFNDAQTGLSSVEARLNELLGQRTTALNEARARAQTLAQGIPDIPLYDEDALTGRRGEITTARGGLSRFTGADSDAVFGDYDNALTAINTRLTELTNRRAEIERQAQQLMERANSGSFFYLDDLGAPQTQLDALRADSDLFKARQALDEIDAITRRLTSERRRMEQDAAQVRAREDQERQAMANRSASTDLGLMTPEQYQAFLTRRRQEDPLFIAAAPTGFSSSLVGAA